MQVNQVEATVIQMKMRVVKSKMFLLTVPNRAGHKDWCICRDCKKKKKDMYCVCSEEVTALKEINSLHCQSSSRHFAGKNQF